MKRAFIYFLLVFRSFVQAQKIDKENAFFTIRGDVNIPRSVSSMMYRESFSGIYSANLNFNLRLFGNFHAGLGYQNSLFKIHKSFIAYSTTNQIGVPYNTQLVNHGAYLNLGYDQYFSNTGYMTYSLRSGVMFSHYTNVIADTSVHNQPFGLKEFTAGMIEPCIAANFVIDENETMTLGFTLSYTTLLTTFDPKGPRLNHLPEVYIKRNNYFMSWINIGVGFNVLIGKSRGN